MDACRDPVAANHPITVRPAERPLRVHCGGQVLAETSRALVVAEHGHPPVAYIPREDVRNGLLQASDKRTRCPFKGEARYYHIATGDRTVENAVWTYERPCPVVAPIATFLAFFPDAVEFEEVAP